MTDLVAAKQTTPSDGQLNEDRILIVGPEKTQIKVNSQFLSAASKPLRAMFKPEWESANGLKLPGEPYSVLLPEDDPAVMQVICAVIHLQNHMVPKDLPVPLIFSVAVTADKYDCIRALKFASNSWCHPEKNHTINDLFTLAAAAYLFEDAAAFKSITKQMILIHKGPFAPVPSLDVEAIMDWRFLGECAAIWVTMHQSF